MIEDIKSGIKSYRATLDEQFLLMKYDSKNKTLSAYQKIEKTL